MDLKLNSEIEYILQILRFIDEATIVYENLVENGKWSNEKYLKVMEKVEKCQAFLLDKVA